MRLSLLLDKVEKSGFFHHFPGQYLLDLGVGAYQVFQEPSALPGGVFQSGVRRPVGLLGLEALLDLPHPQFPTLHLEYGVYQLETHLAGVIVLDIGRGYLVPLNREGHAYHVYPLEYMAGTLGRQMLQLPRRGNELPAGGRTQYGLLAHRADALLPDARQRSGEGALLDVPVQPLLAGE